MRRIINSDGIVLKHFSIKELTTPRNSANLTNMKLLSEYLKTLNCELETRKIGKRPDADKKDVWMSKASNYECIIYVNARSFKFFFSKGIGNLEKPTLEEVIPCLISDAGAKVNYTDFEGWCEEFGYDTDSISHFKTYQACCKTHDDLCRVFGVETVREMMDCENDF